ncbi:cupin-like domain-containing protein [Gilvimarinus agarilyticus]|uniref:cupin-like domain-containing protein n=1 Tax=Gilvimarinus sp. 2_MG-2023 TaxID=3062666 RepID=UPI001C0A333D|nr:cupin-like domain-containing protein [Gilvimarinus sp. 2_MG-2023]MBU2887856.1 cupin-like domain-containing protein [Gilvimarinus agarilyticus]MDO6572494.1 cupin-like domain-containing protein [Gilvimarinus sp. 2_MG-2023]
MSTVANHPYTEPGTVPEELPGLSVPVVLKGFVSHWPAVAEATVSDASLIQYLKQYSSDLPVTFYQIKAGVTGGRIGYLDDFSGFTFDRASAHLNEVLNSLQEAVEGRYIGSTRIDKWLPGFREKNDIVMSGAQPLANFWIGGETDIAAHFDSPMNIACCVSGKREFTLFPPEQVTNLYIGPVDRTPSGRAISMVNFDAPDLEKFPKFSTALEHSVVARLQPGDALYIPPLWWHRVKSSGPINMLVNYWWKQTADYMGVPDLALEHAILALRGMNTREKASWKAMFEHYVFSDNAMATDNIPKALQGMLDPDNEPAARLAWMNFAQKLKQ